MKPPRCRRFAARPRWLLLALAIGFASSANACPLAAPDIDRDGVALAWRVVGEPLAVGRHFALDIAVCPATARLVRVDAIMPEHRHGMNYRPTLERLDNGHWRARGFLFHMPGDWELLFDLRMDERAERLSAAVHVR